MVTENVDPNFNCRDIALELYNEMPKYRAARAAHLAALANAAREAKNIVANLPKPYPEPETYWGWVKLVSVVPTLQVAKSFYEGERFKVGFYASMFQLQDCFNRPWDDPPKLSGNEALGNGGGADAGGRLGKCYELITFWIDTGEIIRRQFLGCFGG